MENFICSQYGETRYIKHQKYKNLWINNKARGDKNATCLHFLPYMLNICKKFEFIISRGSVATFLR